jgi:hypothetical protein
VQVVGEVVALHVGEVELAADVLREPAGDLDPADVLADRVMAARFGDEDAVARAEPIDGRGAADELGRSPLKRAKRIEKDVMGFRAACRRRP